MAIEGDSKGAETIEEIVDDVLKDFANLLPADIAAEARELVLDALELHPSANILVGRIAPRVAPERSGSAPIDGAAPTADVRKIGGDK